MAGKKRNNKNNKNDKKKDKKIPVRAAPKDGKRWFLTVLVLATVFILGFLIAFFMN